ncbi:MAG TPA: hypothetical protein VGM19_05635 [Armatimonadota bacterium]|jgi:hypothetical protein
MKQSRRRQLGALAIFLVVVGLMWREVFVLTGILWWQAPRSADRPAPPPPAQFKTPATDWIDLQVYYKSHPEWPI